MSKIGKFFLSLLLILLIAPPILWICGLMWFKSNIPLNPTTNREFTDVVVVLTGGSERLHEGVKLLKEGYAEVLFISGVGKKGTTEEELLAAKGFDVPLIDLLKNRIVVGFDAKDTMGNAEEVARWIENKKYTSIRLVTSNYHIQRSFFEFRKLLPKYKIIPHPVISDNVILEHWWRYKGTRELIISEYDKFLGSLFHYVTGLGE